MPARNRSIEITSVSNLYYPEIGTKFFNSEGLNSKVLKFNFRIQPWHKVKQTNIMQIGRQVVQFVSTYAKTEYLRM